MRVKVVLASLDCSVLLAGKLCSQHGGNARSEQECKAVLLLTVSFSIIFEGGAKIAKYSGKYPKDRSLSP